MIYVIIIRHIKVSYSLIDSQLLLCALAVYLKPTFTALFQSEAHLESSRTSAVEHFLQK